MMEIDARVQSLVSALNDLPGVMTFSSCGGHVDPAFSQVPADEFYVEFQAEGDAGRLSLERVVFAADSVGAWVTAWFNGDEFVEGGLCFDLKGVGLEPDLLADKIRALYDPRP